MVAAADRFDLLMIPATLLFYLDHCADLLSIKTSRGIAAFRVRDCVGEFRLEGRPLTRGLPRLQMARAVGARILILGIERAGGRLPPELIDDALPALEGAMNVVAGLDERNTSAMTIGVDPPEAQLRRCGKRRPGRRSSVTRTRVATVHVPRRCSPCWSQLKLIYSSCQPRRGKHGGKALESAHCRGCFLLTV